MSRAPSLRTAPTSARSKRSSGRWRCEPWLESSLSPLFVESLTAAIGKREYQRRGEQEERRRDAQRETDADPGPCRNQSDRVRRDCACHASDVVARALSGRAHARWIQLRDETAEHAEVAVAEIP